MIMRIIHFLKLSDRLVLLLVILSILGGSCDTKRARPTSNSSKELRIVSLAPSLSKDLELLGVSESIVGVTNYCEIGLHNEDLIVGNTIDINIEKVLLLNPVLDISEI